eukprot:TRINITY_DN15470_c0_g1_i1.p1 TRINITY_DN15470_c0_g1~~TRINITY_DN15470_c0_g1_i1.p1  ORF type:complete len:127 (-),score=12.59 TRINITY_DN15470_c0_g1_i1:70-450(-)
MAFDLSSVLIQLGIVSTSDHASVVSINKFVTLLCACIMIGYLLEEYRWMNESITALDIGLCTGVVILLTIEGNGGKSSRSSHRQGRDLHSPARSSKEHTFSEPRKWMRGKGWVTIQFLVCYIRVLS